MNIKEKLKKIARKQRWLIRYYFNRKYAENDPYYLTTSDFEQNKMDHVVKVLKEYTPKDKVMEVGCGEGILANLIAKDVGIYEGFDISQNAIRRAIERNKENTNVSFSTRDFYKMKLTENHYDVMIFSEVLFYFSLEELKPLPNKVIKALKPGAYLVLVHCRATGDDDSGNMIKDYGAKTIHDLFIHSEAYELLQDEWDENYRISVLKRA